MCAGVISMARPILMRAPRRLARSRKVRSEIAMPRWPSSWHHSAGGRASSSVGQPVVIVSALGIGPPVASSGPRGAASGHAFASASIRHRARPRCHNRGTFRLPDLDRRSPKRCQPATGCPARTTRACPSRRSPAVVAAAAGVLRLREDLAGRSCRVARRGVVEDAVEQAACALLADALHHNKAHAVKTASTGEIKPAHLPAIGIQPRVV